VQDAIGSWQQRGNEDYAHQTLMKLEPDAALNGTINLDTLLLKEHESGPDPSLERSSPDSFNKMALD
jgi:hypothetical protein